MTMTVLFQRLGKKKRRITFFLASLLYKFVFCTLCPWCATYKVMQYKQTMPCSLLSAHIDDHIRMVYCTYISAYQWNPSTVSSSSFRNEISPVCTRWYKTCVPTPRKKEPSLLNPARTERRRKLSLFSALLAYLMALTCAGYRREIERKASVEEDRTNMCASLFLFMHTRWFEAFQKKVEVDSSASIFFARQKVLDYYYSLPLKPSANCCRKRLSLNIVVDMRNN